MFVSAYFALVVVALTVPQFEPADAAEGTCPKVCAQILSPYPGPISSSDFAEKMKREYGAPDAYATPNVVNELFANVNASQVNSLVKQAPGLSVQWTCGNSGLRVTVYLKKGISVSDFIEEQNRNRRSGWIEFDQESSGFFAARPTRNYFHAQVNATQLASLLAHKHVLSVDDAHWSCNHLRVRILLKNSSTSIAQFAKETTLLCMENYFRPEVLGVIYATVTPKVMFALLNDSRVAEIADVPVCSDLRARVHAKKGVDASQLIKKLNQNISGKFTEESDGIMAELSPMEAQKLLRIHDVLRISDP